MTNNSFYPLFCIKHFGFNCDSTAQEFITKHKLVLGEMRALANDSKLCKNETSKCNSQLDDYIEITNHFMKLARLVSLEQFTRDGENISKVTDDFLSRLHNYQVGESQYHPKSLVIPASIEAN